jgi:hypothetical protein
MLLSVYFRIGMTEKKILWQQNALPFAESISRELVVCLNNCIRFQNTKSGNKGHSAFPQGLKPA